MHTPSNDVQSSQSPVTMFRRVADDGVARESSGKKKCTKANSGNAHFARNNSLRLPIHPTPGATPRRRRRRNPRDPSSSTFRRRPPPPPPPPPPPLPEPSAVTATAGTTTIAVVSTPLSCLHQCIPGVSHCKVNKLLPDKK